LTTSDSETLDRTHDVREHPFLDLLTLDLEEQASFTIESEQWFSLDNVDLQPVFNDLLGIVASPIPFGSGKQSSHEFFRRDIEMNHCLEFDPFEFFRKLVCSFGLPQIPREPIEHVSASASCFDNRQSQYFVDQLIGHKVAALEIGGRCFPDFSTRRDFPAQEIATRQVRDSVVFGQPLGLSSLASTRWGD
jgi:hypothetical protein